VAERADVVHRRAQLALADRVSLALANLIASLPDPESQDAIELYAPSAARIVAGGQERAARFSIAYVAQLAARSSVKSPPTTERALASVLVSSESPVARSPILRLWGLRADGEALDEATRRASSYAGELATGDLQVAQRAGLEEGARASAKNVRGWRKELSADACEWCRKIASGGGRYRSAETVPFHARDHCSVAPVFE
jgi:hypothetical protein